MPGAAEPQTLNWRLPLEAVCQLLWVGVHVMGHLLKMTEGDARPRPTTGGERGGRERSAPGLRAAVAAVLSSGRGRVRAPESRSNNVCFMCSYRDVAK